MVKHAFGDQMGPNMQKTLKKPPTALLIMAPVPVNMSIYAIMKSAKISNFGFSVKPKLHLAFLVRPELPNSMPAAEYDQQGAN